MVGEAPEGYQDQYEMEGALPVLSVKEIRALLRAPKKYTPEGKRDAALIAILVLGGLRAGEAATLPRQAVTFITGGACRIRTRTLKRRNHWRTVTIPPVGARLIRQWFDVEPGASPKSWLFPAPSGHISVRTIERRIAGRNEARRESGYLAQIGRPDLHLHNLRHSALSLLMMATSDIWRVKNQAGHASLKSTEVYLLFDVRDADANAEAMAGSLKLRRSRAPGNRRDA